MSWWSGILKTIGNIGGSFIGLPMLGDEVGGLLGAGSNIATGVMGSNAAKTAAGQQVTSQQTILDLLKQLTPQQLESIRGGVSGANTKLGETYGTNMGLLAPYLSSGTGALDRLNTLTAGGGFKAPTAEEAANSPGEQFRMQQGQLAQQRSAAAAGGVLGGGEAKALQQYTQDLASTDYNNVYNRAMGTYQTNFGNLQALANLGMGATNTGVSTGNMLGSQQAANTMQGGLSIADILGANFNHEADANTNIGNAQAAGTMGGSNALTNGINGATTNIMGVLQSLLNKKPPTGGASTSYGNLAPNGDTYA